MAYAQQIYPQKLGTGSDTITNAGCFLTAFCNLEGDFGVTVDPLSLNQDFINKSVYTNGDILGWSSINRYDPATIVGHTADHGTDQTAGWPTTNQSIVRFYYRSYQSGQMIYHFCKVESVSQHLILDSWDGIVKSSPYGEPTAWAEYNHTEVIPYTLEVITPKQISVPAGINRWNVTISDLATMLTRPVSTTAEVEVVTVNQLCHHIDGLNYYIPADGNLSGYDTNDVTDYVEPIAPPPAPYMAPAGALTATPAARYKLVATLLTFKTASDAMAGINAQTTLPEGTYYIWDIENKAYQLGTDNQHKPEFNWVNTMDNKVLVVKPVISVPVVVTTPVIKPSEVAVGTDADTAWKGTFTAFYPERSAVSYKLLVDVLMKEYSGKKPPIQLYRTTSGKPTILNVIGTFVKDGVMFYRLRSTHDEWFVWFYGVSMLDDNGQAQLVKVVETKEEVIERRLSDFPSYWRSDLKNIMDIVWYKIKGK